MDLKESLSYVSKCHCLSFSASYGGAFTAAQLQQAQALAAASAAHPQLIAAAPAQAASLTASHAGLAAIPGLQTMPAYTTVHGGNMAAAVAAAAAANPYQAAAAAQSQNPYAGATLQPTAETRFA